MQKKWTQKEKETCIRLRRSGLSMSEIGEHIDRSKSSVSNFLWALNQTGTVVEPEEDEVIETQETIENQALSGKIAARRNPVVTGTDNEMVAEACTENIRTLEQLIVACNIDTKKWQIERWTANTWPVGSKEIDGEGNIRIVTKNLYQVKAIMKLKPITQEEIRSLFADIKVPTSKPIKKVNKVGRKLLEISIPDLHLGKLAWGEETGYSDYDTKIAMERFKEAIDDLLTKEDPKNISQILLPIGNDLLNSDGKENETANGTPQTEDSRWQKSFKKACEAVTWAINRCLEVAPVSVPIVPGNHDQERSYYLGCFLEARFAENPSVKVRNDPTERKYFKFGNTLIGFTHGDRIKLKDLIALAQNEQRQAWGKTKYCELHLGHLHRESVLEEGGVIARVIPSLCSPDAWHSKHGYVFAVPSAQAFVYDMERGLESIFYHRVV